MKKKIISLLLVAVMILSIVPTYALPVFAAECEHVFTEETLPDDNSDFWDTHSHDDYYEGSNSFISAQVPAGCLKDGWRLEATDTTGFCMICGEFITENDKVTLPATGHDFSGTLIDEATCTEAARRECAHNNYEIKVEQDPITGLYSASYISIPCDVVDYSELEEDAALGHDPQEAVLENFINCEYDDDLEQVVSTNCTEKGTYDSVVYCDRCTAELSRDTLEVEARGHDWDAGRVTTDPTCEEEGVITYTCNYDETHTYTEPIDATGHGYQLVQAVDPTCEEDGHIAYYSCENCDKIFSDDQGTETTEAAIIVEALGHDYNVIDEQEPTCDVPGYKTYECSRCHKQYIEVEQALGHQVDWNIIYNADCENDGLKEGVCSVCHKTLREVIPATGHNYQMTQDSVLPGCETYGNIIWVCQNDASHTYREYREPTGHDWQLQHEEAATCIEGGYQEFVCKNDASHTYKEYVSDALGHLPKEAVIENLNNCEIDQSTGEVVSNTCREDGSYDLVVYCDRCNAELSRETVDVERLDHIEEDPVEENYVNLKLVNGLPVIDPITGEYQVINCNQAASYELVVYCERCGEELSRETVDIAAPGHNWQKQETKYPTCTEEGYNLYTCTRCGESFNEYLAPLGHRWERTDVADCIHGNKFICTREVIDPDTGVVILDGNDKPILCGETYEDDAYNYNLTFTVDSDIDKDEFGYIKYNDANRPAITKEDSNDTGDYKFEIPEEEIPEGADIYISSTGDFDIDYGSDDEGNLLTGHEYNIQYIPARCEYDAYYLVECVREDWDEERYCPAPDAETAENEIFLVVIPNSAIGHNWALRDDGSNIDPHCTTDGTRHWYCLNDHNHTYTEKLPATGHNWVLIESVAATCGTDGYEVYQCQNEADDNDLDSEHGDICGEIKTVITAPATGNHTYTVVRHAATCTEDGYDEYTCSVCGYSYQIATTPAKGHNYVVTDTVAATCTTEGYDVYTCNVCGDTYNKTTTHALDHHFVATSFVEPTCTSYGYTVYKCIRCEETFNSDYIPAKEHNFVADVTAPTCTEEGYTTFTCSVCGLQRKDASGEVYKTNITKPVNHVMNTIYTVAPTCGVDGKKVSECINCAYKQEEVIPATGNHQYDEKVTKNPTCAELGEMTYTCKVCGYSYTEELAKTDDHQYSDVITTAATCGADGVMTHKCDICGEEYTTVIPATGDHKYESVITKQATCMESGIATLTCKECGIVVKEEIPAIGTHSYDAVYNAPTCIDHGYYRYTCKVCGDSYIVETNEPATGHEFVKTVKPASGAKAGLTIYTCSVCGEKYTTPIAKVKSATLSQTRFFYSGKNITPLVKVVDANGNVLTTAHYTVNYKNNKAIGTGVVVIKFRGNYTGTMTRYFNIIPKNVGLSNRSSSKGQIKFTWGIVGNCDGYQLQYSTNSNFKSAKTININNRDTCVQLFKNLKSGSTYYIRIRAFKIVNNTKVVGNWSACSIKCK